jgi:hypothetical protein
MYIATHATTPQLSITSIISLRTNRSQDVSTKQLPQDKFSRNTQPITTRSSKNDFVSLTLRGLSSGDSFYSLSRSKTLVISTQISDYTIHTNGYDVVKSYLAGRIPLSTITYVTLLLHYVTLRHSSQEPFRGYCISTEFVVHTLADLTITVCN